MTDDDKTKTDISELATSCDMYDRLAATVDQPDIDQKVSRAVVLQLAGGVAQQTDLGEDIRGDIHLGIVSEVSANVSRFLSAVRELAPIDTGHINGTSVTQAGAIGSVSRGGELTHGPLLDDAELTLIEQLDAFDRLTQNALQQILDVGSYSFTKANYRKTVSAPGSVLLGVKPKYDMFDDYEPIYEQLNMTNALFASLDLTLVNIPSQSSTVKTAEQELNPADARQYLSVARRKEPTLSDSASEAAEQFATQTVSTTDKDTPYTPEATRLKESVERFATANARLQLRHEVTESHVERIIPLFGETLEEVGIIYEPLDVAVDTQQSEDSGEEDNGEVVYDIVSKLVREEYDSGVPVDVVKREAMKRGMLQEEIENKIETLKFEGELYTPSDGVLRTT